MKRVDTSEVEKALEKRFGRPVLFRASDPRFKVRRISTRIPILDRILGGGVAKGRTTEFYGPASAAKSLTVQLLIAEAQSRGMTCALADTEGSFDPKFARHFGVDVEDLFMISDLERGEQVVDYCELLMRSHKFDLIAIDSVDALVPKKIMEKSAEDDTIGRKGQLTSAMMRRLTAANQNFCTLILVNQVREAIGIMFGNPERPVGGRAISHYASQRVEFRQGERIQEEVSIRGKAKKLTIGHAVNVRVAKDKTGPNAFRDGTFRYYNRERRIDLEDQLLSLGLLDGEIEQVGNRYTFAGSPKLTERQFCTWLATNDIPRLRLQRRVSKKTIGGNGKDGMG